MYWQATWAEQDARTKNVETSLWFTKKIHSHWEKQGKLLSETAFFPTVKAKRSTLHFFQKKSKIIATTTDTAHGEYPPWNSHNTWNTAKASYDFISVKASWHVEKNGGDFCACRWFRLGKELQKTVFESLTPTSLAQRRSSCYLWYFSWETAIRVIRWEPSLLQKNDVSKQQERYLQCFHASCYVIYAIHIYIYINMNIRIYHESICIYTSCAQSVYLICHCQLLRWLLRQGPTSAFNSTGSQLQHRQWRISRWSLWRFSSVGSAQQKPTPKLQRWTATV